MMNTSETVIIPLAPSCECVALEHKLRTRQALLGVIGLGYVGLPLALSFERAGFQVTGFDISSERIAALNNGRSYITDISDSELTESMTKGKLKATADLDQITEMDAIIICVP